MSGSMWHTLVKTPLEIHVCNGLIEFVLYSRRCICKTFECIKTGSVTGDVSVSFVFCSRQTTSLSYISLRNCCPNLVGNKVESVRNITPDIFASNVSFYVSFGRSPLPILEKLRYYGLKAGYQDLTH